MKNVAIEEGYEHYVQREFDILCKIEHPMPNGKSVDKAFPINYSIIKGLEAYVQEKKFGTYYKRYCFKHRSESLNFFCETCKILIC